MNLPMIFAKVGMAIRNAAGTGAIIAKKHAPEIMIATGIVGFGVTIVETVKATNKTNDILEHKELRMEVIDNQRNLASQDYTIADYQSDISSVNRQAKWDLIKTWIPVATTGVSSVILVLGGYRVLNGRYVATAAAYKTLEAGFDRYRGNVIDEFGKDVDWRMAHSLKAEELEEERRKQDEVREKKEKNKKRVPRTQYSKDINNQIFDCHSSDYWKRFWTPDQALIFVQGIETKLQDKLNCNGHVFLNEAFDMLGMPRTAQGALVGWINTPRNNHTEKGHWLSLGYANNETPEEEIRRIHASMSNEEIYLWITPNCDGVIYNLIDKPFSER